MTKVIILGQEPKEEKNLKPIEVKRIVNRDGTCDVWKSADISDYNEIKVIKVNDYDFDCIIITDTNIMFLGHFNDGIVE